MTAGALPGWELKSEGVVLPEERLPAGQTIIVGLQHVFTMLGSTVVLPRGKSGHGKFTSARHKLFC